MVVVMAPDATQQDMDGIVELVRGAGGEAFITRGMERSIVGLVGDVDQFGALNLRSMPGVSDVVRISVPYKLVSREHHPSRSVVRVGGVPIGPDTLTVIAGPCAVESAEQALTAARMARAAGASLLRGGAFKPRTSPYAYQGLGEAGLKILAEVGRETGLPTVTEVIDPRDVDLVCDHADMLQVGTRNMQNFALLQAVGSAGKPVLLKRGFSATIEEWLMAAEYIAQRGNLDIVLCERGIRTFEKATRNTLDISAVPVAQRLSHLPVIVNPSHSGGRRDLVLPLTRAAIAVGADGLIIDVHPEPTAALCDGDQALLDADIRELAAIAAHLPPLMGRTLTPPLSAAEAAARSPEPAPARLISQPVPGGWAWAATRHWRSAKRAQLWSGRYSWAMPASSSARSPASSRASSFRRSAIRAWVSTWRGVSSVQQSWSGSSDRARVRIRRASAMISILSSPISGRRIGSATASSSAVRLASVWLLTWPSESPVTSAAAPRRWASTSPVLSIRRRCATICSRLAPDEASFCCVLPNATTHSRESHWKRSSWYISPYALYTDSGPVSGMPEKCRKSQRNPRRIIRYAATGESMPPDISTRARPLMPTGSPPWPGDPSV